MIKSLRPALDQFHVCQNYSSWDPLSFFHSILCSNTGRRASVFDHHNSRRNKDDGAYRTYSEGKLHFLDPTDDDGARATHSARERSSDSRLYMSRRKSCLSPPKQSVSSPARSPSRVSFTLPPESESPPLPDVRKSSLATRSQSLPVSRKSSQSPPQRKLSQSPSILSQPRQSSQSLPVSSPRRLSQSPPMRFSQAMPMSSSLKDSSYLESLPPSENNHVIENLKAQVARLERVNAKLHDDALSQ